MIWNIFTVVKDKCIFMIKIEVGIKKLTFTVYNAIDVMSLDQKNIC